MGRWEREVGRSGGGEGRLDGGEVGRWEGEEVGRCVGWERGDRRWEGWGREGS